MADEGGDTPPHAHRPEEEPQGTGTGAPPQDKPDPSPVGEAEGDVSPRQTQVEIELQSVVPPVAASSGGSGGRGEGFLDGMRRVALGAAGGGGAVPTPAPASDGGREIDAFRHSEIVNMVVAPVEPKSVLDELRAGKDLTAMKDLQRTPVLLGVTATTMVGILTALLEAEGLTADHALHHLLRVDHDHAWHFYRTMQGHQFIVCYGSMEGIIQRRSAIARLQEPINLGSFDGSATVFVGLVVAPPIIKTTQTAEETARTLATLFADDTFFHNARTASTKEQIQGHIEAYIQRVRAMREGSEGTGGEGGAGGTLAPIIKDQVYWGIFPVGQQWGCGRARTLSGWEVGTDANVEVKWVDEHPQAPKLLPRDHLHPTETVARQDIAHRTKERVIPGFGPESAGFAGGFMSDVRRRLRYYKSDWTEGWHYKSIPTTIYIYFICMAPGVAFGSVTSKNTNGELGTIETLVTQWIMGLAFALIGGCPLVILRHTGPLTVFTGLLYEVSGKLGVPFMAFYAWTGCWLGLFLMIIAITNACKLIRHLSRFTEEIFAMLINCIFLYEAFKPLVKGYNADNKLPTMLALILVLGTFIITNILDGLKSSYYFTQGVRNVLSDFNSTFAILIMTIFSRIFFVAELEYVKVPDTFQLNNDRPWLVDMLPGNFPGWAIFAAAIPALMAMLLFYVDENVTSSMTDNPAHKLVKGPAYHLDMFVVGAIQILLSVLGLPWAHGSLPHSPLHAVAYADREDYMLHGRLCRRVVKARESRVTAFFAHVLILISSLFLLKVLQYIPLAVFYGLFLSMAAGGVAGNSFWERLVLCFTQLAHYPPNHYVRRVPLKVIHLYTFLQVLCLVTLWIVKSTVIGLSFPFFVIASIPFRSNFLPRVIDWRFLDALDAHAE